MSISNTTAQSGSSPSSCSSCGRLYTPRWLSGLQKWSKVCGNCGVLNLARFMEDNDAPDATIADISAGEQSGAFLRSLVTDTDQPRPVAEAKRLGGGCLNRLVRAWRYCFIRRLAVCPKPADPNIYSKQWPQRMMFQWQNMPHNWRWF